MMGHEKDAGMCVIVRCTRTINDDCTILCDPTLSRHLFHEHASIGFVGRELVA